MIRNFTVGTEWTPIVAPCDCNYYGIVATTGSWPMRCSDPNDSTTAYQMVLAFTLASPRIPAFPTRYSEGKPVTYVKLNSGSAVISVDFVEEWRPQINIGGTKS